MPLKGGLTRKLGIAQVGAPKARLFANRKTFEKALHLFDRLRTEDVDNRIQQPVSALPEGKS